VRRALTPAVDQRFSSALEMQRALEAALPQPVTVSDVAAFMAQYLEKRIETRRKDLTSAIAELEEAAGEPYELHTHEISFLEPALPDPGPPEPPPVASPVAMVPPEGNDAVPTRLHEGSPVLQPIHYAMMVLGAVVPMVVWGLVAWVALHGPIGRKAPQHRTGTGQVGSAR
jgi:hypothetical protein